MSSVHDVGRTCSVQLQPYRCLLHPLSHNMHTRTSFFSKLASFTEFVATDLMPFSAAALVVYAWLAKMICPFPALRRK